MENIIRTLKRIASNCALTKHEREELHAIIKKLEEEGFNPEGLK